MVFLPERITLDDLTEVRNRGIELVASHAYLPRFV